VKPEKHQDGNWLLLQNRATIEAKSHQIKNWYVLFIHKLPELCALISSLLYHGVFYQAGGFDKLLLDSLYQDDASRRQIQLQQAGYSAGYGYGYEMPGQSSVNHNDPFAMSNHIAPPTSVQMMAQQQQQYQMMQQQYMMQQQQRPQQNMLMVHHQYQGQYSQQTWYMGSSNPFGDPFSYPQNNMPPRGNHPLI